MKLIIAYIQPEKLSEVKNELCKEGVARMSVTNSLGCGQQSGYTEVYRGAEMEVNLLQKVRLEIAVNDDFLEKTVAAIIKGAKTGKIGDGKIFIYDVERVIRIRTGEEDFDALQDDSEE